MLAFMRLCPSLHARIADGNDDVLTGKQNKWEGNFRSLLMQIVECHGRDMKLVQQSIVIAATKGYATACLVALQHYYTHGVTRSVHQEWQFFVQVFQVLRKRVALSELNDLYNKSVLSMLHSGKTLHACEWVKLAPYHDLETDGYAWNQLTQNLRALQRFDLLEELGDYSDLSAQDSGDNMQLNKELGQFLDQEDIVGARDCLLNALSTPEAQLRSHHRGIEHLPTHATLIRLQSMAQAMGVIKQPFTTKEVTDAEFLLPIKMQLQKVRQGRKMWAVATLERLVTEGRTTEALEHYASTFKRNICGITPALLDLFLPSTASEVKVEDLRALPLPATPPTRAINLALEAMAAHCTETGDYEKLQKVYHMWIEASTPEPYASVTDAPQSAAVPVLTNGEDELDGVHRLAYRSWPLSQPPNSRTFDPFVWALGRVMLPKHDASNQDRRAINPNASLNAFRVIKDMTQKFHIKPSMRTWTFVLECLAREGRDRWSTATEPLAHALGINTRGVKDSDVIQAPDDLPEVRPFTYGYFIHALLHIPYSAPMVEEAGHVRDDLLVRIADLDTAPCEDDFHADMLARWRMVRDSEFRYRDTRPQWTFEQLSDPQAAVVSALRALWKHETQMSQNR